MLERQEAFEAQLAEIKAQLDSIQAGHLLIPELTLPGYTITPPIRMEPIPDAELQKQMQEIYQELIFVQKQEAMKEALIQSQAADMPMLPTLIEMPATPQATLELNGIENGRIRLNLKVANPIGGPTVHHYELQQLGTRWSLTHTGSTEYL